jgi:hypothetical protein
MSLTTIASAGPKEDVAAATSTWAAPLAEDNPDKVLALYAEDAVLWGTLSPKVRADRAAMRDYFVTAFKVLPGLKVAFGDQLIRVYGGTAVNTGDYTFSYVKDGETKSLLRATASLTSRAGTTGSLSIIIPRRCQRPRNSPSVEGADAEPRYCLVAAGGARKLIAMRL